MSEKVKISKKEFKFLKRDIDLEADVVEKLAKIQQERQKKFQNKIEASRKEALERYTTHIKALEEAKAQAVQRYDDEIKKYKQLVKNLEKEIKELKLKPEKGKKIRARK